MLSVAELKEARWNKAKKDYEVLEAPASLAECYSFDLLQGLWIGMTAGNVLALSVMAVLMQFYWNWDGLADDAQTRTDL
ncbi:hypothetical protein L917_08135 [Phytophthora nicotianae]|nr:hypothetical protein L917_08135 [Phytophthora nicotianae]